MLAAASCDGTGIPNFIRRIAIPCDRLSNRSRRLVPRPLNAAADPHPCQVVERQGDGEQVVRFGGCARCRERQAARRRRLIRHAGVRVGERARRP